MHLAEMNIAQWKVDPAGPEAASFIAALDPVNAAAERMPGFVWRLVGDGNDATDILAYQDPRVLVNMSVWETAEHLENYVWNTVHKRIYRNRGKWFGALEAHHFVMWNIETGHIPTLGEGIERLDHLRAHGNSDHAFDWSHLPHVKLWQSQRCG